MILSRRSSMLHSSMSKSSITGQSITSKRRSKIPKDARAFMVVDPSNKDVDRTPVPLVKDTSMLVLRRNSIRESIGSYTTSGQTSPTTMSEISEMERYSTASWDKPMLTSQTGSSTPTTPYMSDDESFFYNRGMSLNESISSSMSETDSLSDSKVPNEVKEYINSSYEKESEQDFVIDLKETNTIFIFEHFDEAVPSQADYLEEVREANKRFEEAIKRKQTHKELFTNKEVQTLNKFYKNKFTSTIKTETEDQEVSVFGWEIYDEFEKLREIEEKLREERESIVVNTGQDEKDDEEEEDINEFIEDEEEENNDILSLKSINSEKNIYSNPKLRDSLSIMERTIARNLYHKKQLEYKKFDDSEQSLDSLWSFECPLTEGQNVNCMAWNYSNRDILAIGYGNVDFVGEKEGMVLCWTLKNPTVPERCIKIPNAGVTAVAFSKTNPSLLSVGCNDGGIAIFDVRTNDQRPVLEASKNHTGTIWDLQWVDRGKDTGERLNSVGVDGRVNSWSIKKGFECHEIMRLKSSGKDSGQDGAVVSRDSGGMCIDFDRTDPKLYLVGTEDGLIKKCSTSYNEQCLETYYGHTGPVYRVRYNPFDRNTFLSCSADWTIRLWNQEKYNPILTIESFSELMEKRSSSVTDVAWCNHIPTIFASVSITGTVDIWDLSFSALKPRYSKISYGKQLNSILFGLESPVLLVGDNFGSVEVLKPRGIMNNGAYLIK
jgi:WD40 repeat protein